MPDEYARGLGWLRANASRDAVVFADNPSLLLSAFGEVRLYYETGLYTARAWEVGPEREPWPERAALQERLLRRPDPGAIAEARRAVGPHARLLVVADAVQSRIDSGFVLASPGRVPGRRLFPEDLFELRFANADAARLRGAPLADRLERRAPVLGFRARSLETEARERRGGRSVAAQAGRERARLRRLPGEPLERGPHAFQPSARCASSEADGERQAPRPRARRTAATRPPTWPARAPRAPRGTRRCASRCRRG